VVDCADGCQKEIKKEAREKSYPQPVHLSKKVAEEKISHKKASFQKEIPAKEGCY
jgi:hypothetical protein